MQQRTFTKFEKLKKMASLAPGSKSPYYWINLDRAKDRKKHMEELFRTYKMPNKRVSAVDFLQRPELKFAARACLLSHIKAIRRFHDGASDGDYALICEDDLSVEYPSETSVRELVRRAPKDWEVLQLGVITPLFRRFRRGKDRFYPWHRLHGSAVCYAINKRGATKILKRFADKEKDILSYPSETLFHLTYAADHFLYRSAKTYTYSEPLFTYILAKSQISAFTDVYSDWTKRFIDRNYKGFFLFGRTQFQQPV